MMQIEILPDGTIRFEDIPHPLFNLISLIPSSANSGDPRVEGRFFPDPVEPDGETSLAEDWKAYVQPELHTGFLEAREIVQADIRRAEEGVEGWELKIPARHADAWMNVLSQARLALSEENAFTEAELSLDPPGDLSEARNLALMQMHFYGVMQEWFVQFLS